ncbi:MAG: pseudouridine synthase [Chloroflexi bacterium RBG_13_50_10]|nr:MAG: pseudouridine synthase [Chloroflexi bacterium RBG_13_50_10]
MNMSSVPLLKTLTEAGLGSRRRMADAIKNGRVKVNGEPVENFRHPVNPETDHVSINGKPVDLKPGRTIYLMVNKPAGIITTTSDERGRQTVMDILPEKYRNLRLYPVGRLDKDSTGLLLLTNDGELTYRLTHPKFEHEKEYLIHIEGVLKPEEKRKLEKGFELEDGMTYPVAVKEIKSPPFNYSIIMHEGRKRQVRRMLASLGYFIPALKRIRMGSLNLGNLREGATRELTDSEVRALDKKSKTKS